MRLILNHNNGVITYYRGMVDGKVVVETEQDCESIVDANKRSQNESRVKSDLRHIASIPAAIWSKWEIEDGVCLNSLGRRDRSKYLRRKLNDPDWRWLRPVKEWV